LCVELSTNQPSRQPTASSPICVLARPGTEWPQDPHKKVTQSPLTELTVGPQLAQNLGLSPKSLSVYLCVVCSSVCVIWGEWMWPISVFHALKLHGEAESGSWQKFENGRKNSQNNKINHNKPKTWVGLEVFCIWVCTEEKQMKQ